MDDDKKLVEKTTDVLSNAAQSVTEGLKSAGKAVVDAVAPQPIKAGDSVIIPSTDPSMPPVVMTLKKQRRKSTKKAAARRPAGRKPAGRSPSRTASRTAAKKRRASRGSAPKAVKTSARKASKKRAKKQARR